MHRTFARNLFSALSGKPKRHATKPIKSYVTLKQRITAGFMVLVLMLQICLPTVAWAAVAWNGGFEAQVVAELQNPMFVQANAGDAEAYKGAFFIQKSALATTDITDFYRSFTGKTDSPSQLLIGDAFVQTRLIRSQYRALMNRFMSNGVSATMEDAESQLINSLYEAGKIAGNGKTFGQPLGNISSDQDFIWPETRTINGKSYLIPVLYLSANTIGNAGTGNLILINSNATFAGINLNLVTLKTGKNSILEGLMGIVNNGSTIQSSGNLSLKTNATLANLGGVIDVEGDLSIYAENFYSKTLVVPFKDKNGEGTRVGAVANISGKNISMMVGNDVNLMGTQVQAGGTININAGNDINILPVQTYQNSQYTDGHWEVNKSTTQLFMSRLAAEDTIELIAGGAINITASELISTRGGIKLLADQGIYILDCPEELDGNGEPIINSRSCGETEQISKIDRKGKTQGSASEFRTSAVRAVLSAGKGVLLDSKYGDVVLKAAKLTSTTGTQANAHNGKVRLLMTKELEEAHLQTTRTGTWTIKTRTEDIVNETNLQNAIVGGLQVQAMYGIDVEYTGKEGATLKEQIEEYRQMPEMKWMADLYDQALAEAGPNLNWAEVEEIHKELKKTQRSLSPAAMAIIAICVAVAMGPGAGLIGNGGTGVIGGLAGGNVALGAALNAGALTLTTQATQSLAAGNSLRETLNAMDSSESLRNLAVSMATAGAMQAAQLDMFKVPEGTPIDGATLIKQAGQAVVNSTVTAGVSIAINGGNTDDFKRAFRQSLVTAAVNSLTKEMAKKIGEAAHLPEGQRIDVGVQYIAHAAVGCLRGSLTANINGADAESACYSGAGGAIIGEAVGKYFASKLDQDLSDWTKEQLSITGVLPDDNAMFAQFELFKAQGADLAQLSAAFVAFAAGGDVDVASGAGMNAAQNNALNIAASIEKFRELKNGVVAWWNEPASNWLADVGRDSRLFAMAFYTEVERRHDNGECSESDYEKYSIIAKFNLESAGVIPTTKGEFLVLGVEGGLQVIGLRASLVVKSGSLSVVNKGTAELKLVWEMDPKVRGRTIESFLEGTDYKLWQRTDKLIDPKTNMPFKSQNFDLIDFQKDNIVVSLKTIDTKGTTWMGRTKDHIDQLANRSVTIDGTPATKILDVRVQPGGSSAAVPLIDYGRQNGIKVIIKELGD